MFKTKSEIIVIRAEAIKPIDTNVVFWSHDKGTAKLIFQLQKDYMNQPLSAGTIVPILLEFNSDTAEGGRGRHIYHALIEDAVNGIVSIVLEDNILGYQGRVEGSIYIELPDSRSLDTAGRFTFDIKRSPIDENVPELEDYYWQGFNEIMAQYHQTIATIKLEAKTLLDSLTADVTTAQNKVTTLEQSITTANTNLNTRINEINKKIDDNDVFMKQESSANVINQIGGAESAFLKKESLVDGTEGIGARDDNGTLVPFVESDYVDLTDPDKFVRSESLINGRGAEIEFEFPVISTLEKKYPYLFEGLVTTAEKITKYKSMLKRAEGQTVIRGGGLSSADLVSNSNTSAFYIKYNNTTAWRLGFSNSTNFSPLTREFTSAMINTMSTEGKYVLYAVSRKQGNTDNGAISDGTTPAWVEVKDIRLIVELEANGRTIIESFIANNHVENLATPEEAKAGTDTTKTMTPATTAQSIDNRAVTLASNQTIGGLKNFQNEPLVDGIPIGLINEACWCEDFTVNNLAAGIVNPDIQRFSTSNEDVFSSSGKVITIKKSGVYMIVLGVNYSGLTSWLAFGISRVDGTSLVNRNLLGSATSGSNSFTYVRSFEGNDQIRIEFNSGAAGTTMQKINLAIVKIA